MTAAIHPSYASVESGSFVYLPRRLREGYALGTPSYAHERARGPVQDPLAELLVRTAQGDRAAFKQVYDIAAPQLFGIALGLMRRRDQAEDLLQDAFLAIWQKAAQFVQNRGAPMAWMAMIVRHRGIDRLRMSKRRPLETNIEESGALDHHTFEAQPSGECRDISRALATLSDNHRKAVMLAFVEGLTHEELALRLNAPLGTVKSWVRRGLLALKESMTS